MLADATRSLIATARDPVATEDDLRASAQSFLNAAGRSSRSEAAEALRELGRHLDIDHGPRSELLALVCGAMVEAGCDSAPIAEPLIRRLESLLPLCNQFAEACTARMGSAQDEEQGSSENFEKVRGEVAAAMPEGNAAWTALDVFWRPAIAVFSVNPSARAAARGLRDSAKKISDYHTGAHWIQLILSVLDNEPILVIEPDKSLGIVGTISGVVDNFQLCTLLMDAFPRSGFFAGRRISRAAADVARGKGPQQADETVTSVWNMYTWKAVQPGLTLPNPTDYDTSAHWIWNEGSPEDIPLFEDCRVVLLGPPSYPRFWQSQRMFDKLPAEVKCERTLSKSEVKQALERMLEASRSS